MAKATITKRTIKDLSPAQRLEALDRLRQMKAGTLRVPSRCTHCRSTTLTEDRDYPGLELCGSCGKRSDPADIAIIRQREIQATILDGPLEKHEHDRTHPAGLR